MNRTLSLLAGFRMLPEGDRQRLDRVTRELVVHRGQVLFSQGEAADALWAVQQGQVHILKSGRDGRRIVLEVVGAGDLFGAVVALEGRPYPATAIAADSGTVLCAPASVARELCQRYPTLRNAILEHVATRLRSAHERLRSVALERVEQRLARTLLLLAKKIGTQHAGRICLRVTRQELADMTGTTVETTIRVTSRWQSDGIIDSMRHQIELIDAARLHALAAGTSG